jgi:O-antigen/teichoic acid export membrane protein
MTSSDGQRGAASLSLASGSALLLLGRLLEYLAVGVAGVLIARGLGPEGRGIYSLVNQASRWAVAFLVPGLAEAAIYLWGRGRYSLGDMWGNYLAWCLAASALLGAAAAAVALADWPLLGLAPWQLVLALVGGATVLFYQGAQTLLLGQGRAGAYVVLQAAGPLLRLGGIALAAALGMTVAAVLGVWLGALVASLVLALALLGLPLRPALHLESLRGQLLFGGKGFAGWVLTALNHRLDVFIVGGVLGAAAVGQYTVAFNSAELAWWVPLAVGSLLYPKASSLPQAASADLALVVCRRTLLVAAAAIALLALAGYRLIPLLYGGQFAASLPAFYVLLPSGLFYTVSKVLGSSLWGLGRPEVGIYSGLVSVPATLALDLLLVPRLGTVGAAAASDVAYLLNALTVLAFFARLTGCPWWRALLPLGEDVRALTWGLRPRAGEKASLPTAGE